MPRKGKPIPPDKIIRKPGSRRPATWRQSFTGGPAKSPYSGMTKGGGGGVPRHTMKRRKSK